MTSENETRQALDIQALRMILGLSYPTALSYARKHGWQVDGDNPKRPWIVPADVVRADLVAQVARLYGQIVLLDSINWQDRRR